MLTVVTHTRFDRPEYLERCIASVKAALPAGAEHAVIPCNENWGKARYEATQLSEYVCFVDDDDYIDSQALTISLAALESTGAGMSVTNEVLMNKDGTVFHWHRTVKDYMGITIHPRAAHHLVLMRRSAVDVRALELHNKYGIGADWFLKASCALMHGGVQIPIDGYFWQQHENTMTNTENSVFMSKIRGMGADVRTTWPRGFGELPVFEPPVSVL